MRLPLLYLVLFWTPLICHFCHQARDRQRVADPAATSINQRPFLSKFPQSLSLASRYTTIVSAEQTPNLCHVADDPPTSKSLNTSTPMLTTRTAEHLSCGANHMSVPTNAHMPDADANANAPKPPVCLRCQTDRSYCGVSETHPSHPQKSMTLRPPRPFRLSHFDAHPC